MPGSSAGAMKGWEKRRSGQALRRDITGLKEANDRGLASGLKVTLQTIEEEYAPELRTIPRRLLTFDRMANDATVKAQLRANIWPILSAVRDEVKGGSPEMRALVESNLLRRGSQKYWCDTSWKQRKFEALQSLKYGFAAFGKTREIVDGMMIFRRLTYLHPRSFNAPLGPWEWDKSGANLVAIHRSYTLPDGENRVDEKIPIEDVFLSVSELVGDNWEGTALIRPAYKNWKMKELSEKIGMIHLQNAGVGIPNATLGPTDGPKDLANLQSVVESMRGGSIERRYYVLKNGQTVGFLTVPSNTDLSTPLVNLHNQGISQSGTTQFLGMGQTESGSRASDSVHMVAYLQAAEAVKDMLYDQINHGAGYLPGLVEELIYQNFDEAEIEQYGCPEIVGSPISPQNQLDYVPMIGDQVQKGSLSHEVTLENYVRNILGLPILTPAQFEKAKQQGAPQAIGGRPSEVPPLDQQNPRTDTEGRRYGLKEDSCGETLPPRRQPSYPWRRSEAV